MAEPASKTLIRASKFTPKEDLIKLVDTYMDRKFDEEIILVEEHGGIEAY